MRWSISTLSRDPISVGGTAAVAGGNQAACNKLLVAAGVLGSTHYTEAGEVGEGSRKEEHSFRAVVGSRAEAGGNYLVVVAGMHIVLGAEL